jgi:hypothetical protein
MRLRLHIGLFYTSHKNYDSRRYNEALEGDNFTYFANDILKHFKIQMSPRVMKSAKTLIVMIRGL